MIWLFPLPHTATNVVHAARAFSQVVVRAAVERGQQLLLTRRAEHNHWKTRQTRVAPNPSHDGAPVHLGHVEVEQDEPRPFVPEEYHRLRTAPYADHFLAELAKDAGSDDA